MEKGGPTPLPSSLLQWCGVFAQGARLTVIMRALKLFPRKLTHFGTEYLEVQSKDVFRNKVTLVIIKKSLVAP